MQFNAAKCAVIHMGHNNPHHTYMLGNTPLGSSSSEKDVGVYIQSNLKNNEQCKKVARTCNNIIGMVRRSFTNKESSLMLQVYKTYILPHLDYAISVWNPWTQKDINILESIQRRFTRMISGMAGLSYEERLTLLELPTLEDRRTKLDVIQAYRIWNEIDTIDHQLFECVKTVHDKNTRHSSKSSFVMRPSKLSVRKHFFTNRVVPIWNALPRDIQEAPTLGVFKSKVNKLFQ